MNGVVGRPHRRSPNKEAKRAVEDALENSTVALRQHAMLAARTHATHLNQAVVCDEDVGRLDVSVHHLHSRGTWQGHAWAEAQSSSGGRQHRNPYLAHAIDAALTHMDDLPSHVSCHSCLAPCLYTVSTPLPLRPRL